MIVHSLCNSCFQSFHLIIETADIYMMKQIADDEGNTCPCPRLCGGAINLTSEPTISSMSSNPLMKEPVMLTGKQLYQAVSGLGLPDELPKSEVVVDSLIRANIVSKTVTEEKDGSVYLHEIHLGNGTVLHLASGSRGARVLKITKGVSNGR